VDRNAGENAVSFAYFHQMIKRAGKGHDGIRTTGEQRCREPVNKLSAKLRYILKAARDFALCMMELLQVRGVCVLTPEAYRFVVNSGSAQSAANLEKKLHTVCHVRTLATQFYRNRQGIRTEAHWTGYTTRRERKVQSTNASRVKERMYGMVQAILYSCKLSIVGVLDNRHPMLVWILPGLRGLDSA
jgi:hypothetical protein